MQILRNVVEQHCEEAGFLWQLRNAAVDAPHYKLKDLAQLDERLDAHLDGLSIAGSAGWKICERAMANGKAGEVFSAAVLAFQANDPSWIRAVLTGGSRSPDMSRGLISALTWLSKELVATHIRLLLSSEDPAAVRIGLAACAAHRQDPGRALNEALAANDLPLRARALKAIGEVGRKDLLAAVKVNLTADDRGVRYWAAWSGSLIGEPSSVQVLRALAVPGQPKAEQACATALRRMSVQEGQAWLKVLASSPNTLRLAIQAAGVIGDPANIPWLIQQMANPVVARVAGESFTFITGIDLAYDDLETDKPEGFEAGPTENPEDENVEMDPDEDLPWPNPQLIEKWWFTHRLQFTNGTRYLCGQPMTIESLNQVLRTGRQRQRTAGAIELAIRQSGTRLFNRSAPGFRQQALLK
mgnify:CR=1 FL=1